MNCLTIGSALKARSKTATCNGAKIYGVPSNHKFSRILTSTRRNSHGNLFSRIFEKSLNLLNLCPVKFFKNESSVKSVKISSRVMAKNEW